MIRAEDATPYQKCVHPWVFPIRFSLLGTWHCEFQSGPNLSALANYCGSVTGEGGFYGLASARRVNR